MPPSLHHPQTHHVMNQLYLAIGTSYTFAAVVLAIQQAMGPRFDAAVMV